MIKKTRPRKYTLIPKRGGKNIIFTLDSLTPVDINKINECSNSTTLQAYEIACHSLSTKWDVEDPCMTFEETTEFWAKYPNANSIGFFVLQIPRREVIVTVSGNLITPTNFSLISTGYTYRQWLGIMPFYMTQYIPNYTYYIYPSDNHTYINSIVSDD